MKKLILPSFARFDAKMQSVFVNNLLDKHFASREFKINKVEGDEVYGYMHDVAHGVLVRLFSNWIDDIICLANLAAPYENKRHEEVEVDGTDIVDSYRFEPTGDFEKDFITNVETEAMELAYAMADMLSESEFSRLNDIFKEAHTELVKYKSVNSSILGFWHCPVHEETQLFEDFIKVSAIEAKDCYLLHEGIWNRENEFKFDSRSIDSIHEFYIWANGCTIAENHRILPPQTPVKLFRLTDEALSNLEGY